MSEPRGHVARRVLLGAAASLAVGGCAPPARHAASPVAPDSHPSGGDTMDRSHAPAPPSSPVELLAGSRFTCASVHPREPWLATGSTAADEDGGQIVVWDARSGDPVGGYVHDHGIGFSPAPALVQWAPTGRRIAANAETNAILVVEDGRLLTRALPDETRDHPVEFCWLADGSALYAATGGPDGGAAGAIVTAGAADGALRWLPPGALRSLLGRMTHNTATGAIVGDDLHDLVAIDTRTGALRHRVSLAQVLPRPQGNTPAAWSADGRRFAVGAPVVGAVHDRATGVSSGGTSLVGVFDGDDGRLVASVSIPGAIDALRWSAPAPTDGQHRLAIVAGPAFDDPRSVHVLIAGRIARTIDAPLARQSHELPDAGTAVWSPDGGALALLLREGTVRLVSATDGRALATLASRASAASAEHLAGVLWAPGDRIVGLGERRVTFWGTSGELVARHET